MIILVPLAVVYGVAIDRFIRGEVGESIVVLLLSEGALTMVLGLLYLLSPGLALSLAVLAALSSVYYPSLPFAGGQR